MIYISSFSQNQSSPFFIPPLFFPFKSQHCGREGEEEGRRKRDPIGLSHASKQPKTDSGGREKGKGIVRDLPSTTTTTNNSRPLPAPFPPRCGLYTVGRIEGGEGDQAAAHDGAFRSYSPHTLRSLSPPLYVVTSLEAPSLPLFPREPSFLIQLLPLPLLHSLRNRETGEGLRPSSVLRPRLEREAGSAALSSSSKRATKRRLLPSSR